MTRRAPYARALLGLVLLSTVMLSGCTSAPTTGQDAAEKPAVVAEPAPVKIGTLPTEDSLPLWVADELGYFATNGLSDVEIVSFQSAQERDAAFVAGEIDAFMGDIIAAANLEASGKSNTIKTIMLGATPAEGRFAVLVPPGSKINTMSGLAGVPVGTSSATIQEYVLFGLMHDAEVPAGDIRTEEVKKVPVRFELLMAGKLKAAALPEPFVTLAEQGGATIVGDDTKSPENWSQTVLVFSDEYLGKPGGQESAAAVLQAWNVGIDLINAEPGEYRDELVKYARLPEVLASTYKVNSYPIAAPPTKEQVDSVLQWMTGKGYLKEPITYDQLVDVD